MNSFVSCVMATKNRPRFLRQALRYFQRQTHTAAELIVMDDGDRSVEPICAGLERVRYVRCEQPTSQGQKLNMAVELSCGDLIQKLDDDDYYHQDFLKLAVNHFPTDNADHTLQSWDCFLILLPGETQPRYSGHGWTIGNTFLFTRKFWERKPFRDIQRGVDSWFLRDHRPPIVRVCAQEMCIVVRHGANTWSTMRNGGATDEYFARFPIYGKSLETVIGDEDASFYRGLAEERLECPVPDTS
jgi:glycosyltransferase involved in cell wall biosynthesis